MARNGESSTRKKSRARKITSEILDDDLLNSAKEKAAWSKLILIVDFPAILRFWSEHLALRSGTKQDRPLTADESSRILMVVRAVCWIESRHGSSSGSAKKDAMQCGHPDDKFWGQLSSKIPRGDRLVSGPNPAPPPAPRNPNYWLEDMPAAFNAKFAALPGLANASTSVLTSIQAGHDDAGFNHVMSCAWGIVWLVHRMNNAGGGRKTYECYPINKESLTRGAAEYNGKGDAQYPDKVASVLNMLGYADPLSIKALRANISFDFEQWSRGYFAVPMKITGATLSSPGGATQAEIFGYGTDVGLRVSSLGVAIDLKKGASEFEMDCIGGGTAELTVELYGTGGQLLVTKSFRKKSNFVFVAGSEKIGRVQFLSNNEALVQRAEFQ